MDLTPEDNLRLNVLLANKPLAIRIHEASMTLYGLTESGEMQVRLHPNCRDEQYVKRVKEMLSGHVFGSPGGYPVYLQRWTRMGQMRGDNLEQLLLLGEPEAVVAVSCASDLTNELARRAWWAMEDAENARRMLVSEQVRQGSMGPQLAAYLVEHLPFETEAEVQITTVAFVLQPGLIDDATRLELWKRAKRKPSYYVGFLQSCPDTLPEQGAPTPLYAQLQAVLQQASSPLAQQLLRVHAPAGQAYLQTLLRILDKPSTQDVVIMTFNSVANYFATALQGLAVDQDLDSVTANARSFAEQSQADLPATLHDCLPVQQHLQVLAVLAGLNYGVLRPYIGDSTAIGSLMRRKLEPVFAPLRDYIAVLLHEK
jgi:hypothetical protein